MRYDIAVIGNDEAAFEMMALAAGADRRTVAILPEVRHSAWFAGQALRRLIADLLVDCTVPRRRLFLRAGRPQLLRALFSAAIVEQIREQMHVLQQRGVDVILGEASFRSECELQVTGGDGRPAQSLWARHIVIGTGVRRTAMHRPLGVTPFHRPETLFAGRHLPKSVCILGGSDFGAGLAALLALFGVETRLVAREDNSSVMLELASSAGVQIGLHPADIGLPSLAAQNSAPLVHIVDCRRVLGFSDRLNLKAINVEPDENGQLWCASSFETWCSGVFGIGGIVGFSPDSSLHASVQAERIMNRVTHAVSRPHLLDGFARCTAASSMDVTAATACTATTDAAAATNATGAAATTSAAATTTAAGKRSPRSRRVVQK